MKKYLLAVSFLCLAQQAHAQDASQEVYLCIDEQGRKEYKNTGQVKGCKKVDLPSLTTVVAPPKRAAAKDGSNAGSANASPKTTASPPDFPKVDGDTQKKRDSDSKQLLQDELKAEEQKLSAYKSEFNNGQPERRGDEANFARYQERVQKLRDDIARTDANIAALKREIAKVK